MYKKVNKATISNIINSLTTDTIDSYIIDIINILCIPYNLFCSLEESTVTFVNNNVKYGYTLKFKEISYKPGFLYGYTRKIKDFHTVNLPNILTVIELISPYENKQNTLNTPVCFIMYKKNADPIYYDIKTFNKFNSDVLSNTYLYVTCKFNIINSTSNINRIKTELCNMYVNENTTFKLAPAPSAPPTVTLVDGRSNDNIIPVTNAYIVS